MGFETVVAGPADKGFNVEWSVVKECEKLAEIGGGKFKIGNKRDEALKDADIVYCDSWMSYTIPAAERHERFKALSPFQVDAAAMKKAKPTAIFMNCLPAVRGEEQTAEVLDGPQSVIYDQAENRFSICLCRMCSLRTVSHAIYDQTENRLHILKSALFSDSTCKYTRALILENFCEQAARSKGASHVARQRL
jgi:ornithine carbamoyltransferase